jgi:hypothetical protein
MNKSNPGNCNEKQELDLPLLRSCRDYRKLENVFDRELQEYFEAQLLKYLYSKETTDESLEQVPLVICWCEGMLTTAEFINELEYAYIKGTLPNSNVPFERKEKHEKSDDTGRKDYRNDETANPKEKGWNRSPSDDKRKSYTLWP